MKKIGVLAMQGAFVEHISALRQLGAEAVPVRRVEELKGICGLVIPGGESTTICKLMREYSLIEEVVKLIAKGLPVLGTCAGMILLAKEILGPNEHSLKAMNIKVRRNAFGRQVDSFEADLDIPALGHLPFRAVFIRAPWIEEAGEGVEILASLPDGTPVAAREGNIVAIAFHPELTPDLRLHEYFLSVVDSHSNQKVAEM
jgi:pyridoxal 5'-phosphate synthase pdxT subunit